MLAQLGTGGAGAREASEIQRGNNSLRRRGEGWTPKNLEGGDLFILLVFVGVRPRTHREAGGCGQTLLVYLSGSHEFSLVGQKGLLMFHSRALSFKDSPFLFLSFFFFSTEVKAWAKTVLHINKAGLVFTVGFTVVTSGLNKYI